MKKFIELIWNATTMLLQGVIRWVVATLRLRSDKIGATAILKRFSPNTAHRLPITELVGVVMFFMLETSVYAPLTWTLVTANAAWRARIFHTSVVFDNKMWVMGGYTGTYRNDVWYSTNGVDWT